MTGDDLSIGLDEAALDAAFPFRFTLARAEGEWGRLRGIGPRLQRVAPCAEIGRRFEEVFAVDRPVKARLPQPAIPHLLNPLGRDDDFKLRGQFVEVPAIDALVFLGSPWVGDLDDVARFGLSLHDFPPHEAVGDMLLLVQTRNTALSDLRSLNERLKATAAELDERNRRLQQELEERQRLEARVRQIQKMEAVGLLAGGIAHDFNNLMTAILGFASLAAELLPEGTTARNHIEEIEKATERATELTSQLLTFSRRQVFKPRVVELSRECRQAESLLRRLLGEQVVLATDHADEALRIKIDPNALQQVVINLAVNARDAMPRGGTLTVRTRFVDGSDTTGPLAGEDRVMLEVEDEGCGMSPEVVERIFEPFFTTKPQGQGTGLGLATVYGIVKQSGGELTVDSDVGRGSRFRIWLPVTEEPLATETVESGRRNEARPAATILLVEDEASILGLLETVLGDAGFSVHSAPDPGSALSIAKSIGKLDVLVSDVGLPGMPGPALAEAVRSLHPGIMTLFISGYAPDAAFRQSVGSGDHEFLQKPFQPTELVDRIVDLIAGRSSNKDRARCTE